jgi:hypothetical protein
MRKLMWVIYVASMVVGCGDSTGPGDITGTYALQSVNGQSVPFFWLESDHRDVELISGQFTLRADATFSNSFVFRTTQKPSGNVLTGEESYSGTYTVSGSTVNVVFDDHFVAVSVVHSRNTLTMTVHEDDVVYVFRK